MYISEFSNSKELRDERKIIDSNAKIALLDTTKTKRHKPLRFFEFLEFLRHPLIKENTDMIDKLYTKEKLEKGALVMAFVLALLLLISKQTIVVKIIGIVVLLVVAFLLKKRDKKLAPLHYAVAESILSPAWRLGNSISYSKKVNLQTGHIKGMTKDFLQNSDSPLMRYKAREERYIIALGRAVSFDLYAKQKKLPFGSETIRKGKKIGRFYEIETPSYDQRLDRLEMKVIPYDKRAFANTTHVKSLFAGYNDVVLQNGLLSNNFRVIVRENRGKITGRKEKTTRRDLELKHEIHYFLPATAEEYLALLAEKYGLYHLEIKDGMIKFLATGIAPEGVDELSFNSSFLRNTDSLTTLNPKKSLTKENLLRAFDELSFMVSLQTFVDGYLTFDKNNEGTKEHLKDKRDWLSDYVKEGNLLKFKTIEEVRML